MAGPALDATAGAAAQAAAAVTEIDGSSLSLLWGLPFAGMLLSIALLPLVAPHLWERRAGAVALFWALAFVVPFAVLHGIGTAWAAVVGAAVFEYLPFILLLFALFTIAGGIHLGGNLHGGPAVNTLFLLIGAVLASAIGTTGASMVLIRPLLRANDARRFNVHVVVFFIFLVSNVGGALTPLGDPPLFLGFLQGVGFFWTTVHLAPVTGFAAALLLAAFFVLDTVLWRREAGGPPPRDPTPDARLRLRGLVNLPLLLGVVGAILMSGLWRSGVAVSIYGEHLTLEAGLRDLLVLGLGLLSLKLTRREDRAANGFEWGPIAEVAKLFAAIFVTIIPAIAILRAGSAGHAAPLVAAVSDSAGQPIVAMYFWLTGALSSVLDNAPTYLVFFNLAGGDAQHLMGPLATTLEAISAGAVFMGALTYIGNAPNFMVLAIAKRRGVAMPSFFGYLAWSLAVLVPVFLLATLVFFA
ncbi:MAG TPA: sodium:proton antiporter [Hyphomicrobiales bacterium]|nr:sodium:proton antiporter [Hyphomicrobiales bacterium]